MPKNIVVFSDGTGQDGGRGENSNVYKLFNMVLDRSPKQIAFYDRGLGTGVRKLTGSIAGAGISKNIQECYEFIFRNFESGDRVFLFGFSRGATTVRSLSSFIHLFGILPKSRPELIDRAYDIYRIKARAKRKSRAEALVAKHHTMWTKIAFLGVWDTVAALGVPFRSVDVVLDRLPFLKHRFHDLRLSKSVEAAYQALAIDDERKTFAPMFWDPELRPDQVMEQVWFCGMHTDVGGGYAESQLSDVPLKWMVQKATAHGLEVYPYHRVEIKADVNGNMHDSRGGTLSRLYRRAVRSWPSETHGNPVVHASVLRRTLNRENDPSSRYRSWILDVPYNEEPS